MVKGGAAGAHVWDRVVVALNDAPEHVAHLLGVVAVLVVGAREGEHACRCVARVSAQSITPQCSDGPDKPIVSALAPSHRLNGDQHTTREVV